MYDIDKRLLKKIYKMLQIVEKLVTTVSKTRTLTHLYFEIG